MEFVPRVVVVTRPSDYQLLLERFGTHGQVEFFLQRRGQQLESVQAEHERLHGALSEVLQAIPSRWRRNAVSRADLDRFVFEPDDLVVAVGQDGLIANLARYLGEQLVVGVNPMPGRIYGTLMRNAVDGLADLLRAAVAGVVQVEGRTMVEALHDDGSSIVCLNEVFIGQSSHQSARYRLQVSDRAERQSSSGVIVSTGTGATGWASSIHAATGSRLDLPGPTESRLAFFVREPWGSPTTGTTLREGAISRKHELKVVSEMDDAGVIFGDGMEHDCLPFGFGHEVIIRPAKRTLNLVIGEQS